MCTQSLCSKYAAITVLMVHCAPATLYSQIDSGSSADFISARWYDTGAENSLEVADGLFEPTSSTGRMSRFTRSTLKDVHSHFEGGESSAWSVYETRGSIRLDDTSGGVGVTVLSSYPRADKYYRLWTFGGGPFHISSRGSSVTHGNAWSSRRPKAGEWYAFAIRVEALSSETRIRARVWRETDPEPTNWEIDCADASGTRLTRGTVGLWSSRAGTKFWSRLAVNGARLPLGDVDLDGADSSPPPPPPEDTSDLSSWVETGAGYSLSSAPGVFSVSSSGTESQLSTTTTLSDVHAHYGIASARTWTNYELEGWLETTGSSSGIGVTFLSTYPAADRYYRLRALPGDLFEISPRGTDIDSGTTRSTTRLQPGVRYRYRIRVTSFSLRTEILAKVWTASRAQPSDWAIRCHDTRLTRRTEGTVGVWCRGGGEKRWGPIRRNGQVIPWNGEAAAPRPEVDPEPEPDEVLPDAGDPVGPGGGTTLTGRWIDTEAGTLRTRSGLFRQEWAGSDERRVTTNSGINLHSHFLVSIGERWSSYEFRGRFRTSDASGGVGVTFFSSYPSSDRYYRLRAYQGRPFELAPHGRTFSSDHSVTNVHLVSGRWYRFHIDVHAGAGRTEILARVWPDGTSEPSRWQIECLDTASSRFTFGTIGLWSMGDGKKEWSQLTVNGARVSLADDSEDDAAAADPVQDTGESVTLGWDAPTVDANGRSLRDLAGHRVFWSKDRYNLSSSRTVGTYPRVTLSGLDRAVYYVAVTAFDSAGNESPRTGMLTVDLR